MRRLLNILQGAWSPSSGGPGSVPAKTLFKSNGVYLRKSNGIYVRKA